MLTARRLLDGKADRGHALADSRAEPRRLYSSDGFDPGYLAALDQIESWTERSGRGFVVTDSLWSAWDAFAGANSYEDAIKRAVAYGNDTDTTAAIAGGLAGIYWGIDGIPAEWLAGMRGKDIVWPLVWKLLVGVGYAASAIRVDWAPLDQVPPLRSIPGKLGMTLLPGKRYPGQAGEHWRHLATDAATLRDVHGADTLLVLVEDHELQAARVPDMAQAMENAGIELLRFPIVDGGVPADTQAFHALTHGLLQQIYQGRTVVVACMGGRGRTGMTVACILCEAGLHADDAIILTRMRRKGALETAGTSGIRRVVATRTSECSLGRSFDRCRRLRRPTLSTV